MISFDVLTEYDEIQKLLNSMNVQNYVHGKLKVKG